MLTRRLSNDNASNKVQKKIIMERCYYLASKVGLLTLLTFAILQHAFPLFLYLPYVADIFSNITLKVGLSDYSDATIPLTPWLSITQYGRRLDLAPLLMVLNSVGSVCIIIFSWAFAIIIGQPKQIAFSAGLVMLSSLLAFALPYVTIDCILFNTLILGALLCLYRGWTKESSPFWLTFGFLFTGAAGITGGLIGFLIPFATSFLFLVWSQRLKRAGRYDGALAFGIMIVMILIWASAIGSNYNGRKIINFLFDRHIIKPSRSLTDYAHPTLEHSLTAISLWMPWVMTLLFLPWGKAYLIPYKAIVSRKTNLSQNWLWITLLLTIPTFLFIEEASPFNILFLCPLLAIVTAQALHALSNAKSRRLYFGIGVYFLLLGLSGLFISVYPTVKEWLPIDFRLPETISLFFINKKGPPIIAGLFILLSATLLKFTNRDSCFGSLFVLALWTIPIALLIAYYTTPPFLR